MTDGPPPAEILRDSQLTAISELNPEVSDQNRRVVDGTITITWPFSIINKSIAFLLAERDFRLRRDRGQVRIRFHGASAKAIADASLGGGDEIRLSLEGVKWEKNETQTQVAGSTLEWQLEFNNRLILSIRRPDSEEEQIIDIDSPATEPETTNGQTEAGTVDVAISNTDIAIPSPESPNITLPAKRNAPEKELEEFSSPAFLKRARVSYGGLFDGGLDIFDEDYHKKPKSKKRSRFSLPANAWRYASQSPSPEPDEAPEEDEDAPQTNGSLGQNGTVEDVPMPTPPRPPMIDQGCQTADVDFTPMASVQVLAESRGPFGFAQATPTPLPRTRPIEAENAVLDHSLQFHGDAEGHPEVHPDLLSHTPGHIDTGLTFGFTPQTVLFPSGSGFFPTGHDHDSAPESPSRGARVEDYPTEFLDAAHVPPESTVSHPSLSAHGSHMSPAATDQQASFDEASILHSVFEAPSRSPQNAWAPEISTGSFSAAIARSDVDNPVEILSSSPSREPSAERLSPPAEALAENAMADVEPEPALEEPSSEAEHYRDGGDEPGDDYDLRNYDRAHDDDDDVQSSEEEGPSNNVEAQMMNPEEDEMDEDEELDGQEERDLDEEPDDYEEEMYEERFEGEGQEYEGTDDDAEGEYYSGEEGSYDEEEEEGDGDARAGPTSRFAAPQEPVFISLLSDSEDEEETEQEPEQEPQREPEPESEPQPEPESKSEPEQKPEPAQEPEPERELQAEPDSAPQPELEPEPEPERAEEAENPPEKPEEAVEKAAEKAVEEPVDEPVEEPVEEPAKEVAKEPAEEPTEEQVEEQVAQPKPDSPAEKSPHADLEEAKQTDEADATNSSKPEEPDHDRGSAEPPTGTMEDDTKPSPPSAALDTSKDQGHDSAPPDEKIPDVESAHQAPSIQSPQSVPAQGPQPGEPEAAPENEISGDMEMDNAPALAEESKDKAENEASGMNDSDEAHPAAATTEEQAEAMEVDETHEVPEEPTTAVSLEIADTTTVVTEEVDGTIAEGAQGPLAQDEDKVTPAQAPAGEEAFAEPRGTPENGAGPWTWTSPTAPAAGMALAGEQTGAAPDDREAVVEARESQGQDRAESPDATMQDASGELTVVSQRPTGAEDQTGHGEGAGEAGSDGQLATHGQMSPPPTQISHPQASQDTNKDASLLSQAASFTSNDAHLPTPGETQQEMEVEMAVTLTTMTNREVSVEENDVGPDDQIMAEILQHSPIRPDTTTLQHANPAACSPTASLPKSSPRAALTEELDETPSRTAQRAPEAAPVTKSLRSRRQRSSKSSDHADVSQSDPSILLATGSAAPTHGDGRAKHSSPTGSVRMTRSRADDPSFQLLRVSAQTDEGKGKGKRKVSDNQSVASADTSPPGSHRVTRQRVDEDPSIRLIKGSSPSMRQADEGKGRGKRKVSDNQSTASADNSSPGSQRVTRQKLDDDPSIRLIKASSPSMRQTRSHQTPDHRRETPKRETRSVSRSVQLRGDTPGASSVALKSPSIAGSAAAAGEDENVTVGTLKLQLARSLRTNMPDFMPLKSLRQSLNKTTDILAVATSTPEKAYRPKHGPRDYMLTLNLTDPSSAPSGVCVAQIFRPHLAALPEVHIGDVVLLRRFHVVSMKGRGFGLRAEDASAWAVFEKAGAEMEPQVKGPPVEFAADEVKYAEGLRRWWSLMDEKALAKIEKASRKVTEAGKDGSG